MLTSNRKLSKGGAEQQGAAPEKKTKNGYLEKIPVQLWRWGLRRMQSRQARALHCFEETVGSGGEEDEVQTAVRRAVGSRSEQC